MAMSSSGTFLPPKTVNQIEEEVQQKNHPAQHPGSVGKSAAHQRQRQHGDKQQHCTGDRDGTGGNGAAALAGIFAVIFPIPDVVDDVNGRGQQREREKCQNAGNEAIMLEKLTAAQERKKNQQIFNPVLGADQTDVWTHGKQLLPESSVPTIICFFSPKGNEFRGRLYTQNSRFPAVLFPGFIL